MGTLILGCREKRGVTFREGNVAISMKLKMTQKSLCQEFILWICLQKNCRDKSFGRVGILSFILLMLFPMLEGLIPISDWLLILLPHSLLILFVNWEAETDICSSTPFPSPFFWKLPAQRDHTFHSAPPCGSSEACMCIPEDSS